MVFIFREGNEEIWDQRNRRSIPFQYRYPAEISILPEVKIEPVNYRMDSLQNRIDYAKAFNYKKPDLRSIVPVVGLTIIVDIDELIRALQYKKKRRALDFQRRLLQQERDKFIDHRFSKSLVTRITGLTGAERDSFMIRHRPTYEFTKAASEYDLGFYIKESFENKKKDPSKKNDE